MNSFAIWHKTREGINKKLIDIEVHLNLWKLKSGGKGGGSFDHFLDMGIMLEDPRQVSNINVFIPSKIYKNEITDLGRLFREHVDLVPIVFNKDYSVKITQPEKPVEVLNRDNEFQFNIYKLDIDSDIDIQYKYNGSIITIPIPDDLTAGKIYYRLRIKSKVIESLSYIDKPANAILESAFACTEIVDFRLNEKRNLHDLLLKEIHEGGEVKFKPIHLFVMREADYDYLFSSGALYRSRELEKDLWNKYVGGNYSFNRIIAYQWMEPSIESFYAFVKFRFRRSNWKTILYFLLGALFIAAVGGAIGSWLVQFF